MNNTSPFSFLPSGLASGLASAASRLQPPAWLVHEVQQRLVLLLNHVLVQEPEAQSRLMRQKGRVVQVRWGAMTLELLITPAGLTDRADPQAKPDLLLSLADTPAWTLAHTLMQGERPPVQIEGDVQLAAEIAWLADNLRWDLEEDLSRVLGDVPAHALADAGRRLFAALRELLARLPPSGSVSTAVSARAGA